MCMTAAISSNVAPFQILSVTTSRSSNVNCANAASTSSSSILPPAALSRVSGILLETRDNAAGGSIELEEVLAALAQLTLEEREVVTLRIWNGATFEEIAAVMHMPLSTVH